MLQGGDERELDRLPLFVAGLRRGGVRGVLEVLVRKRLEPDWLRDGLRRLMRVRLLRWAVVDRQDAPRAPADRVEADVGRDPVKPARELCARNFGSHVLIKVSWTASSASCAEPSMRQQ
jgi:hypothetical protein